MVSLNDLDAQLAALEAEDEDHVPSNIAVAEDDELSDASGSASDSSLVFSSDDEDDQC